MKKLDNFIYENFSELISIGVFTIFLVGIYN